MHRSNAAEVLMYVVCSGWASQSVWRMFTSIRFHLHMQLTILFQWTDDDPRLAVTIETAGS